MKKLLFAILFGVSITSFGQKAKVENVILVTLDGFRWQELFRGADSSFMKQQTYLKDKEVKEKYWRADLNERRKALLPFFWSTMVTEGQLYGNRDVNSKMNATNEQWFSYPGYNELLTGKADDERITSNDKIYNPNTTVLEFVHQQPSFKGKVAAFTSWDVFSHIINDKRSGIPVSAGLVKAEGPLLTEGEKLLNQLLISLPNAIPEVRQDALTFYYAMEYVKKNKPRLLYLSFDETDDFAHQGEYAAYLNSAHATDNFLRELWNYLQSDPTYKNKTAMIITVDHGRGEDAKSWKSHGRKIQGADQIWMAVIGPNIKRFGETKDNQLYQNQLASTIANLLGFSFEGSGKGNVLELTK